MANKAIPVTSIALTGEPSERGHNVTRNGENYNPPQSYLPPPSHKKKPYPIWKAQFNLLAFYQKPKQFLVNLLSVNACRPVKRKERREVIIPITGMLLDHCDLITLSCRPLSLNEISETLGIGLKRVKRVIRDLTLAGYIKTTERWVKRTDGTYKGLIAIRALTESLFHHLGISSEILRLQRRGKEKLVEELNHKTTFQQLNKTIKPQGKTMRDNALAILKRLTGGKPRDG